MEENRENRHVVFLLKSMQKRFLQSTLEEGKLCFNFPTLYNEGKGLSDAQKDRYDSHIFHDAKYIVFAPIIKEDREGIHYGKGKKIADKAKIYIQSDISKRTPVCCFRIVSEEDYNEQDGVFAFEFGETVERIKKEFGHDAFILITDVEEFLKRVRQFSKCSYGKVHYGETDENFDPEWNEPLAMFQKRIEYSWQKEFRIVLEPRKDRAIQFVTIGDMRDIALGGSLDCLKSGLVIGESKEKVESYLKVKNK